MNDTPNHEIAEENESSSDAIREIRDAVDTENSEKLQRLSKIPTMSKTFAIVMQQLLDQSAMLDDVRRDTLNGGEGEKEEGIRRKMEMLQSAMRSFSISKSAPKEKGGKARPQGITLIAERRHHIAEIQDNSWLSLINLPILMKLMKKCGVTNVRQMAENPAFLTGEYVGETFIDRSYKVSTIHHLFEGDSTGMRMITCRIDRLRQMPKKLYQLAKVDLLAGEEYSYDSFRINVAVDGITTASDSICDFRLINSIDSQYVMPEFLPISPESIGRAIVEKKSDFPDPTKLGGKWTGLFLARMYPCKAFADVLKELPYETVLRNFAQSQEYGDILKHGGGSRDANLLGFIASSSSPRATAHGLRGASR
jgi:hypothetical protein